MNKSLYFIISMIVLAAITRLLPHPPNFTALGALALFSGAMISNRFFSILLPLAMLFFTDIVLNNFIYASYSEGFALFYPGAFFTYLAIFGITAIGMIFVKSNKPLNIGINSLAGSLLFFVVSNFGVWLSSGLYSKGADGLITAYIAAIPFFGNMVMADLIYAVLLFGAYHFIIEKNFIKATIKA